MYIDFFICIEYMPRSRSRFRRRENSVPHFVSEGPLSPLLQSKIRNIQYKSQINRMKEEGKNKTKMAMNRALLKMKLIRFHPNHPPNTAYPLILHPRKRSRTRESVVSLREHTLKRQLPTKSVSFILRMSNSKPKNKHVKIVENV